jgi:hypothetical protein
MKNLLISIALLSCMIGCKKKKEWNVIKYKIGNVQYYSNGNYSSAIGDGNTPCKLKNGRNNFSGYDGNSNSVCVFKLVASTIGQQLSDSAIASANWFNFGDSIFASIYLTHQQFQASGLSSTKDYKCGYKTASYTILQDTPEFIEGTFEGKVYTNPKDPMLSSTYSLMITDGYFCIPKTK